MTKSINTLPHPNKTLFPERGFTKKDVAAFEQSIATYKLPYIKDRPLTLRVFPQGVNEDGFFRKNAQKSLPDHIKTVTVPRFSDTGKDIEMVTVQSEKDLVFFAGQNVIEYHMSLSKAQNYDSPEEMVFDFDPADKSPEEFEKVRKAALALYEIFQEKGITSFVKTTGSKGVHVHIPLKADATFKEVKKTAKSIAESLHDKCPGITTLEQRKQKRGDKVFIDILRNDHGMTAIAPYSLRAIKGAPIATPIEWDELKNTDLTPRTYTMENILNRMGQKECPWKNIRQHAVRLKSLSAGKSE